MPLLMVQLQALEVIICSIAVHLKEKLILPMDSGMANYVAVCSILNCEININSTCGSLFIALDLAETVQSRRKREVDPMSFNKPH